MKLDLACGNNKKEGFIGVDITKERTQADIIHDLEVFPYPFDDESVEEIFCSHYIEHTPDLIAFMNEVYRIMKPDGLVTFVAPYYSSIRAWQDPTHKRTISENTFWYFNSEWRFKNNLDHYPINTDFKIESINFNRDPDFAFTSDEEIPNKARHLWNVYADIIAVLRK